MYHKFKTVKSFDYNNLNEEAQSQISEIYFPIKVEVQEDLKDELSKELFRMGALKGEKVFIE